MALSVAAVVFVPANILKPVTLVNEPDVAPKSAHTGAIWPALMVAPLISSCPNKPADQSLPDIEPVEITLPWVPYKNPPLAPTVLTTPRTPTKLPLVSIVASVMEPINERTVPGVPPTAVTLFKPGAFCVTD